MMKQASAKLAISKHTTIITGELYEYSIAISLRIFSTKYELLA